MLLAGAAVARAAEPTGEYPQSTFERQQLTDRSGIAVNVSNGNLLVSNTDLNIAGTGLDLTVGRFYNGLSDVTGSIGTRWKLGTGQDVRLYDGGSTAKLQGPTGDVLTFTQSTTEYGVYDPPPGVHATLWGCTRRDHASPMTIVSDSGSSLITRQRHSNPSPI